MHKDIIQGLEMAHRDYSSALSDVETLLAIPRRGDNRAELEVRRDEIKQKFAIIDRAYWAAMTDA